MSWIFNTSCSYNGNLHFVSSREYCSRAMLLQWECHWITMLNLSARRRSLYGTKNILITARFDTNHYLCLIGTWSSKILVIGSRHRRRRSLRSSPGWRRSNADGWTSYGRIEDVHRWGDILVLSTALKELVQGYHSVFVLVHFLQRESNGE